MLIHLYVAAFVLQWQSCVVVTEITWLAGSELFTLCLFTEEVAVRSSVQDPVLDLWAFEQLRKLAVPSAVTGENL